MFQLEYNAGWKVSNRILLLSQETILGNLRGKWCKILIRKLAVVRGQSTDMYLCIIKLEKIKLMHQSGIQFKDFITSFHENIKIQF